MAYTLEQILAALGKVENGGIMVADLQSLISSTRNEAAAMKMVTGLFSGQGHTWREAVAANGKGREMYTALRKELQETAGTRLRTLVDDTTYRIVTLPSDIGHQVADYVSRESLKGRRASDLEDEIRRMFPDKTQARAELIARTQVSMTSTNMTRQRAERYGMNWYIWRPVGGAAGATRSPSWTSTKWTNITDEDIEKADDTIQDSNEGMGDMGDMFGGGGHEEKDGPVATGNGPRNGEKPEQDKLAHAGRKTAVKPFPGDEGKGTRA